MLLAVLCGKNSQIKRKEEVSDHGPRFPFPEIVSSGRLEVRIDSNGSKCFCYKNLFCFVLLLLLLTVV